MIHQKNGKISSNRDFKIQSHDFEELTIEFAELTINI